MRTGVFTAGTGDADAALATKAVVMAGTARMPNPHRNRSVYWSIIIPPTTTNIGNIASPNDPMVASISAVDAYASIRCLAAVWYSRSLSCRYVAVPTPPVVCDTA